MHHSAHLSSFASKLVTTLLTYLQLFDFYNVLYSYCHLCLLNTSCFYCFCWNSSLMLLFSSRLMWGAKMPHSCAALNCLQRCTAKTRSLGITFHRHAIWGFYDTQSKMALDLLFIVLTNRFHYLTGFLKVADWGSGGKQPWGGKASLQPLHHGSAAITSYGTTLTRQVRLSGSELELFRLFSISLLIFRR